MRPLSPGYLFADRFEIDRSAGSGGMGVVYRARDRDSGRVVALKLLQDTPLGPDEAARFAREAQLLSELRHDNIVAYVAHGQTAEGQRFLAMEWLEGEDLAERLTRGPLSLRDCVRLLERVAQALVASHQRGILHRDLKPSNLYLPGAEIERVKLLDFGIARRVDSQRTMTRTGLVVGTPDYMSPEQARGERQLTPAADIFSVGCILYECLTGKPPFAADHLAAVLARVLFEEPPPVEERRLGIPPELSAMLKKMLAKDAAQRLPDGVALRAAVLSLGVLDDGPCTLAATAVLPHESRPSSLRMDSEQGLLSVVIAAPPSNAEAQDGPVLLEPGQRQRLLAELHAMGVRAEFLASDALVVTVSQLGSATDLANLGAQAALAIKKRWPMAMVSLATGRGTLQGRTTVGEVVDRVESARSLRSQPQTPRSDTSGIWLDELSSRLLAGRFNQAPHTGGALLLCGEETPDVERKILGKPTPFVGREAELNVLDSQLETCMEDVEARVALITAPPGAGKSRLLREFLRRLAQRDCQLTIIRARGDLTKAGAPYALLGELVRSHAGLSAGAPIDTQRGQLAAHVGRHLAAENRERVVAFIGELCGVPFSAAQDEALAEARSDPRVMHEQIRDAFAKWLHAECSQRTLLVLLDDLHWADSFSITLLDHALRELRASPLFVLALARPDVRETFPRLWPGHHVQDIPLRPLGRKACERLAQHILGKEVPSDELNLIVRQSAGNAFFLEELIRARLEGNSEEASRTVMAMLQVRIGRFDPGLRQALRAASVFGQTFWRGGVAALLGVPTDDPQLDRRLRALVEAEVIEPHETSRLAGDREFAFRHALFCDAAYQLLTPSDLASGHCMAARYLEQAGEPEAVVLADHFRRGAEPERAIYFYLRASENSSRMAAQKEAREQGEQARKLLEALPDGSSRRRLHIDILLRLVQLTLRADPAQENQARLSEAQALHSSLSAEEEFRADDERRQAWIEFLSGRLAYYQGNTVEALRSYQSVLPMAKSLGDERILAVASMYIGGALMLQGQMAACQPFFQTAAALQDCLDGESERLRAMGYCAISRVGLGRYAEGMLLHEKMIARAEKSAKPALLAVSHLYRCFSTALCGDFAALLGRAKLTLEHAQKSEERIYRHNALSLLGWAQGILGSVKDALACRAEAKSVKRELGGRILLSDWFAAADAEIALRAGDFSQALKLVQQSVPEWRRNQRFLALGLAEQVWGLALGFQDPAQSEEADSHLQQALSVMTSSGQVLPAARLRLEWARLCHYHGAIDRAEDLRMQAVAQFEAAGCRQVVDGLDRAAVSLGYFGVLSSPIST
ncbi:serine/threonine-protein kinase [Haliangium sp. UPWRP_2]|uniref:serine/threonine-protein kinase n=1 Tax=Haliangium sp. UPWRP_2 TaxID=1931276 RepID=UPI001304973B|nr:serine/threonine-protein kinase [Haliangium sp. UPWRP_2]